MIDTKIFLLKFYFSLAAESSFRHGNFSLSRKFMRMRLMSEYMIFPIDDKDEGYL
jgi:hypothetical protein